MQDGMTDAPKAFVQQVCEKGEFPIAAIGLEHGHIYGMCQGLEAAGATVVKVFDEDPRKVAEFIKQFPAAKSVSSEYEILEDRTIKLVATAHIPSERGPLGLRVMNHNKDFFSDKAPFTTLSQLEAARKKVKETGRIWAVCYSERVQNESAVFAGQLIEQGAIGRVIQVIGLGPHRLNAASRPIWFFIKEKYGGIICDIGSHQVEQFLFYAGAKDATVVSSHVANFNHPQYPELEDFGEANLIADNGATNYFRVDWFTPDGLRTWGDGRTFILGTDGYIEMRKYIDVARSEDGDHLYLVNGKGEKHFALKGKVGFPYFGQLILDCLNRTQNAMPQEHTFKAAELALIAQEKAVRIR
ncbi:MAG: Gfo/Idh/MocA family oxidoreductase [candidate division KSB1 bacterium]|nr:Gfo/Idh/MocA family oxidoreductase [candidate division KSB1 bacterium]MDZ7358405.1 Gfo/Idh/MocA family oxidoreductase [candidate division KSB1 bacterium]MDZ7401896.1 Gfo/Idh/MocA family oxidoreductase [candidate division KSB1 bacterium]